MRLRRLAEIEADPEQEIPASTAGWLVKHGHELYGIGVGYGQNTPDLETVIANLNNLGILPAEKRFEIAQLNDQFKQKNKGILSGRFIEKNCFRGD
jgi:hypothetical protein